MSVVVSFILILLTNGETVAHVRVFETVEDCWFARNEAMAINRVLAVSECVKIVAEPVKQQPLGSR